MNEFREETFDGIDVGITPNIPTDDIENDRMFLMSVVMDESGSMWDLQGEMRQAIKAFIDSIQGSKADDEMLVSLTRFSDSIKSSGFQNVADMPTDYNPGGNTALYDAIIVAQERLYDGKGNGYMEELKAAGTRPRGALVIWSDGEDNVSKKDASDVRNAIKLLRQKEILVAWVAFGPAARNIADNLGIEPKNIKKTDATASDLRKTWGIISKSAASLSQYSGDDDSQDDASFFAI